MDFTQEQKDEIRASYRDAKNPEKQISILADLYACTKNDIMQLLEIYTPSKRVVRSYDQSVRQDLTKAVLLDGQTVKDAAERFGIPFGTASDWVQKAKKKQAEFLSYNSQTKAHAKPAKKGHKNNHNKSSAQNEPYNPLKLTELQKGLDGLGDFILAFYGVEFITESDQQCLDEILLKAEGFIAGVKAASQ